ncbi:hypothetical protein [Corynebacterium vitaeruminis]|uniref:hypothetical protein n=1 Tax=Corynebacterium vitaeruminis TaxID=38305 RepID=UPI00054E1A36|nr:hypothetical protein [Corynebacterium vitaeruminis]
MQSDIIKLDFSMCMDYLPLDRKLSPGTAPLVFTMAPHPGFPGHIPAYDNPEALACFVLGYLSAQSDMAPKTYTLKEGN